MVATVRPSRRAALRLAAAAMAAVSCSPLRASPSPVRIGMTAELKMATSTSHDMIRLGVELAIEDLNAAGGVLGGRPLQLEVRDDRSVPSRGVENLRALAALPDLVAVFGSRFSPVLTEMGHVAPGLQCPVFSPWAAGSTVLDPGRQPDWSFRVSLNDTWAMKALLRQAHAEGHLRVGLIAPNSGWGRSCQQAAEAQVPLHKGLQLLPVRWYNWGGETSLIEHVLDLKRAGMQALLLVANEPEGMVLAREMLDLPVASRLPILSHWGIAGGDFPRLVGPGLHELDLRVVQTRALLIHRSPRGRQLMERAAERMGVADPMRLPSLVGLGQGYDTTLILHRAIERARSTRREAIREALEQLDPIDGVVRRYAPAFTRERHEALSESDVMLARWDAEGRLQRVAGARG
ncbi:amino acid/amide ABC transporter substrate-binding protein (HAAT family) [Sphaerotilus hippei]|uniref:Amino acid/amide ABC transporter substrate-binding protein (HAAT family) n=1 Tax=Sphaerotilus hippei TaxID=744406 RepID=A0A318GWS3_9BURK|nr:ABC transporter substrate-binding protein [Sphaerotilus hippei]PXW94153.1 amino acid/amide ABC transporter substrate-binding protein (HAAT family) [Sphaerotilus hippei]